METTITLENRTFRAASIPLAHCNLLVIVAENGGMLGCGYVSAATAEKLGDALAVVSGVATFDDMLAAEVKQVSAAAFDLGVRTGMTGREALLHMK